MALTLTAIASDNFQRANENPLSDGGNWTETPQSPGVLEIVSDVCQAAQSNNHAGEAYWSGNTFPADQYCKIVLGALTFVPTHNNNINLWCRMSTGTSGQPIYYNCSLTRGTTSGANNSIKIGWTINQDGLTSGVFQTIQNITFTAGDVWIFAVVGSTLYVYQNGNLMVQYTDTNNYVTAGQPGIMCNIGANGGSLTGATITSWEGGSAAVAGDAYDPTLPFLGSVSEASVDNGGPYCGHVAVLASAPPGLPNPYLGRRFKVSSAPAGPNDTFIGQVVVVSGPPEGFAGNDNELGYHVEK
jgi:hypothetical protein